MPRQPLTEADKAGFFKLFVMFCFLAASLISAWRLGYQIGYIEAVQDVFESIEKFK